MSWENRIAGHGTEDPAQLLANPDNWRIHPEHQGAALETVLADVGWVGQVIVNRTTGHVVDGHLRVQRAIAAGQDEVPVVYVELTEDEERKVLATFDSIGSLAVTDDEQLRDLVASMPSDDGLTDLWQRMNAIDALKAPREPPGPQDPPADPVTQPGDLWLLGPHRLLCGDSTSEANIQRLLNGETPDIVYTDPPYSSGGHQESGKKDGSVGRRDRKKIQADNLSTRGYQALMGRALGSLRAAHTVFIFCDWKMWVYNQEIAEAKGYRVRNMVVWDKLQMGMGSPFRNQHELCLFGSKIAGKIGDGVTPNLLSYPRDREAEHVTPKPVALIMRMLNQVDGDLVVDPFGGGGSTLIAADTMGRRCFTSELDPAWCDVIVRRWEQHTGLTAERAPRDEAA